MVNAAATTSGPVQASPRPGMQRWLVLAGLVGALVSNSGCSRHEEGRHHAKRKSEQPAYAGTTDGYAAPGWKAGDAEQWHLQLQRRTQRGQNEYNRMSPPGS